jgi:hypothetical protein
MLSSLTLKFTAVCCPKCNAPVGEPCHSASGRKLAVLYPHVDRVRAFQILKGDIEKPRACNKTAAGR